MKKLYLASKSPRRINLLKRIGIPFQVIDRREEEAELHPYEDPQRAAENIAKEKASHAIITGDKWVVTADTIVSYDNTLVGKPNDKEEAFKTLSKLNDDWHQVFTGICLYNPKRDIKASDVERTAVKFRNLHDEEIRSYIDTGEPMDKAGAYGIQKYGALLIEKINGCFYNVMGLPLNKFQNLLASKGVFSYNIFMEVLQK